MASIRIYRGNTQIGGCCTEFMSDHERVLLDFGSNLPDCDSQISDEMLVQQVFDGRPASAVLFSHPHGDHYGLYKQIPSSVPIYSGPLAKKVLGILTGRVDSDGYSVIRRLETYEDRQYIDRLKKIRVKPLRTDHSAPDAYMFYLEIEGKKILFTGDFREHGALGENEGVWKSLEEVPKGIDLLITEGTMLSRGAEAMENPVRTEADLGAEAARLFREKKYNFVLVSSMNLDSIMEFYQNTPEEMPFVCDDYQAELILAAMADMRERSSLYQVSRSHSVIRILYDSHEEDREKKGDAKCEELTALAQELDIDLHFQRADGRELFRKGFVMLVRKNKKTVFRTMLDHYYPLHGRKYPSQIIHSMWKEYLPNGSHPDSNLIEFLNERPVEQVHTSGHAHVETIARLVNLVDPEIIVPMHTELKKGFGNIPEFSKFSGRFRSLEDGKVYDLDEIPNLPPSP